MFSYGKSGPLSIHGFLVLGLVPKHATILLVQPMCSGIYHSLGEYMKFVVSS